MRLHLFLLTGSEQGRSSGLEDRGFSRSTVALPTSLLAYIPLPWCICHSVCSRARVAASLFSLIIVEDPLSVG